MTTLLEPLALAEDAPKTFDAIVAGLFAEGATYRAVADRYGCSIGKVYEAAKRIGARKSEARIRGRLDEARMQDDFLASVRGRTVKSDVVDFLEGLPDDSVDLVLTSPPYNVGKRYGASGDVMAPLKYDGWMRQIIAECERVTKPGGVIAMIVGGTRDRDGRIVPLDPSLIAAFRETSLVYQNRAAWPTRHGLTPRRRMAERWEAILVYAKPFADEIRLINGKPTIVKPPTPSIFNPTPGRTPQKHYTKRAFKGPNKGKLGSHVQGAFPSDVWTDVKHVGHNHGEKTPHPAQFSEDVARKIVEMYTNAGMLVCDPFSGSGTTQMVCYQECRDFVGADLFYEVIREGRLSRAKRTTYRAFPGVTPETVAFWEAELGSAQVEPEPWRALARRVDVSAPMLFDEGASVGEA